MYKLFLTLITKPPEVTVEHGQLVTKNYLGKHKVITAKQQFLGLILWFFMYLKRPQLLRLFAILL